MSKELKPLVLVFAGPNGSGKSTITKLAGIKGEYINADEIKKESKCTDMEAALKAEALREEAIRSKIDFTFETVLSTERNLNLLKRASANGYFIKCFYVFTQNPVVNTARVATRVTLGGHDVPTTKIIERYHRCLKLLPELVQTCDIIHVYDNTKTPVRIFKKRKNEFIYFADSDFWTEEKIKNLIINGKFEVGDN